MEQHLEQEQEFQVNKLMKKIKKLENDTITKQLTLEQVTLGGGTVYATINNPQLKHCVTFVPKLIVTSQRLLFLVHYTSQLFTCLHPSVYITDGPQDAIVRHTIFRSYDEDNDMAKV